MIILDQAWYVLKKAEGWLAGAATVLAAVYIFGMGIAVTLASVGRYLFNFNIPGIDELSGYMLVFVTYMGLAYALRTDSHISVEVIRERVPRKIADWMWVGNCFVGLFVIFTYSYYALATFAESIRQSEKALSLLQTPLWIPRSFICVGWLLMCLSMVRITVEKLARLKRPQNNLRGG